jgi:hypothetical protein
MEFNDIHVFGETDSPDCPQDGEGGFCIKTHKMAFMTSAATYPGKAFHIDSTSPLPIHNIMGMSSWYAKVTLNRVKFVNLKAKTKLGMDFRAFQMNPFESDLIPVQEFYDTEFINVEEDALAYFMEPP